MRLRNYIDEADNKSFNKQDAVAFLKEFKQKYMKEYKKFIEKAVSELGAELSNNPKKMKRYIDYLHDLRWYYTSAGHIDDLSEMIFTALARNGVVKSSALPK